MSLYNRTNYLIITPRISALGGAQLYTLRRANYLYNKGFAVYIVVTADDNFILEKKFENFNILKITEFRNSPSLILSEERRKILYQRILGFIKTNGGEIFIESHSPILALWGEILSNKLNCRHVIYFLSEPNINSNSIRHFKPFFLHKLKSNELIGISNTSLKVIFNNEFDPINNNYVNVPFDASEIIETSFPPIQFKKESSHITIGTVSRLSKSYIESLIKEIIALNFKKPELKIKLVIAGDDHNAKILPLLKKKYSRETVNLNIYFTGYINPLGKDFFKNIDIFIGMGTAVINSLSQKCATITIDPITNKASGILGITTNNFAYSETGILYNTSDLIEQLINDDILLDNAKEKGFELYEKEFSLESTMRKLDSFVFTTRQTLWNVKLFFTISTVLYSIYAYYSSKFYLFLSKLLKLKK